MDQSPGKTEAPPTPAGELAIRVRRDGTIEATYDGDPVPVERIDIDQLSIRRLEKMRRLLR